MKQNLTIEQSAELIKRGVTLNENDSEVFDIGDLLSILPKTINFKNLYMVCIGTTWEVGYRYERKTFSISEVIYKEELIDALYELVIWCIDNLVELD